MPIVQVFINEDNQLKVRTMLDSLDIPFAAHQYTINSLELIHSKRGIISLHEVIHYYLPEKMIEKGWSLDILLPDKIMNANGYCGHIYRAFVKGPH